MVETLSGKDLVNRISEDSEAVIEEILEAYGNKILKLCFVQLGNKEEAEDATQEVFLKVFNNLKRYNGESSMYTWIYRITINTCFDILKKRKKHTFEDISLYLDFIKDSKETEEAIISSLTSQNIIDALMRITEKYRILLYMFYFEELKISQIAFILQEKENTIKTRLKRGKNALRRIIEGEGI